MDDGGGGPHVDATAVPEASVEAATPVDAGPDGDDFDASDMEAMSTRAMGMIEHTAGLIDANKKSCVDLGQKLAAYYDENAAFIVAAKVAYGAMPHANRRKLQQRFRKRFDAAWTKLQPTIKKCKDEPNVKDVLDKVF